MKKDDHLISIGEFASKAGITLRTLRYYDSIDLLKPCSYSDTGHRMYNKQDLAKLQKILTLKFIGFSLEDIKNIIKHDINDKDFRKSLEIQKKIMEEKIQHTYMVIKAIDETIDMLNYKDVMNWDKFTNIISILNTDQKLLEQYKNASNLRARIKIHELYSVNKYGWMKWFFEQLNIPRDAKILELGCGGASLWVKNLDRIPQRWDITENFHLENGLKQVEKWFKKVKLKRYEDSLIVTDAAPLIDYIFSMPGNVRESFDERKLKQFVGALEEKNCKENGIYITKDTGFLKLENNIKL